MGILARTFRDAGSTMARVWSCLERMRRDSRGVDWARRAAVRVRTTEMKSNTRFATLYGMDLPRREFRATGLTYHVIGKKENGQRGGTECTGARRPELSLSLHQGKSEVVRGEDRKRRWADRSEERRVGKECRSRWS